MTQSPGRNRARKELLRCCIHGGTEPDPSRMGDVRDNGGLLLTVGLDRLANSV
jgi:hypothetical protein